MSKSAFVLAVLSAFAVDALADKQQVERQIAERTSGFEKVTEKDFTLGKNDKLTFKAAPGDCITVVVRMKEGAAPTSSAVAQIYEPSKNWGFGIDHAEGGAIKKYCLTEGGNVRVEINHHKGKGKAHAEIWKVKGSEEEVASAKAKHDRYVERNRQMDLIEADQKRLGCPECKKQKDQCRVGNPPRSWRIAGFSCERGYDDCLGAHKLAKKDCTL